MHVNKESLKAETKKLEKMQEKVKNMQKHQCKDECAAKKGKTILIYTINRSPTQSLGQRLSDGKSSNDNDNEYEPESEEDSNPNTPGFSNSVC